MSASPPSHYDEENQLPCLHNDDGESDLSSGDCISFRPLQESDRDQIQLLHEDWFPVRYKNEFYDELVHHRMFNSGEQLLTCAAVYEEEDPTKKLENVEYSFSLPIGTKPDVEKDESMIVGCIVGSFVRSSRLNEETAALLISDCSKFTNLF